MGELSDLKGWIEDFLILFSHLSFKNNYVYDIEQGSFSPLSLKFEFYGMILATFLLWLLVEFVSLLKFQI